jgi:hypothetical protein
MVQSAVIYKRQGCLYVRTSSKTTQGSWTEVGECTVLEVGEDSAVLGDAVRKHVAASTHGVPFQGRGTPREPDLLVKAAKVSSRSRFDKTSKCVSVDVDSNEIVVSPHKNNMPGFTVITGSEIRIPLDAEATILGREVLHALELSS